MSERHHATLPNGLRRRWQGFGTSVEIRLWPRPDRVVLAALRLAQSTAFLHDAEQRFSRFRSTSELSRLNARAGTPVRVSRLMVRLVAAALAAARATNGLFDPTVQRAMLAAGYVVSLDRLSSSPARAGSNGPEPGRFRDVTLDVARQTVSLPAGVGLDLGGIAKGWLADAVLRRLRPTGAVLVDLGGDCAFTAPGPLEPPWMIEVDHPWHEGVTIAEIGCGHGGGVATSGILRRRWRTDHGPRHHLIDPRTGLPAHTDLASVTVIGPRAGAAEVLAKAVLLQGRERGVALLARNSRYGGLLFPIHGPPIGIHAQAEFAYPTAEAAL